MLPPKLDLPEGGIVADPRLDARARQPIVIWDLAAGFLRLANKTGNVLKARIPSAGAPAADVQAIPNGRSFWLWGSLIILVLVPVATGCIYFGVFASGQFVSEMRFAIRGTTVPLLGSDALAASGLGTLAVNSTQDVLAVADYIGSRAMVDDLAEEFDLRAVYSKRGIDWWARFEPSRPAEALLRYWRDMVQTSVELSSGIITVTVRAFSPDDSVHLATVIRRRCEIVANQLLDRARQDAIDRATAEVKAAKARLSDQEAALERFRDARMQIDPMDVARTLGETLTKLRQDLIRFEVKLNVAKASLDADAPQINLLAANRQALVDQIADLETRITSANLNSPTASAALAGYDRLEVEKSLAEQTVALAERQLERAQADARRQHIYFITIQDPTRPQIALAPPRLWWVFDISIGSLGFWVLATLTLANVRDHAL